MKKRILSMLLVVCMVFTLFPSAAYYPEISNFSEADSGTPMLCEEHTEHNEGCGYKVAVEKQPCGHSMEDGSYSCASALDSSSVNNNEAVLNKTQYACGHNDSCGYAEAVASASCTHTCSLCKLVEDSACTCSQVESGEGIHSEGCSLYKAPAEPKQADAVKNVFSLINALPTMAELEAQNTEGAEFPAYLAQLRLDTAAARAAYAALTAEEKTTFDAAVFAKLIELEGVLAATPALMISAADAGITINTIAKKIYANGKAITISEIRPATSGGSITTIICVGGTTVVDFGNDLSGNTTNGYDLTEFSVYGGSNTEQLASASVTMTGGRVNSIYGGGDVTAVDGEAPVKISGGDVIGSIKKGDITTNGAFSVTITGGNVNNIEDATPSNGKENVYKVTYTETFLSGIGKLLYIREPANYELSYSKAINEKWTVYLPVGVAKATYNTTKCVADVTTNNAAVFAPHIAARMITEVPSKATAGTGLALTGTVAPNNASFKTIVWSMKNAGDTGATIEGNILSATASGTVTILATIINGTTESSNFTEEHTITVAPTPTSSC